MFFDLPQELRDMIYDYLKVARPCMVPGEHDPTEVEATTQALLPKARLICRRFKDEAEKEIERSVTLRVIDHEYFGWSAPRLVESVVAKATSVEIVLMAECVPIPDPDFSPGETNRCSTSCQAARDVDRHKHWIEELLKCASRLSSIRVVVYASWYAGDTRSFPLSAHGEQLHQKLDDLVGIPKLVSLEVHKYRKDLTTEPGDRQQVWAKYDRKGGWRSE